MPENLLSTGLRELDDILLGGLVPGRTYLFEGDPGSGKTTLGLTFALEGVAVGQPTLYVSLAESKVELHDIAESHGWSLEGLDIAELVPSEESLRPDAQYTMYHPAEVEFGESLQKILDRARASGARRVVLDSLSEIRLLAGEALRYRRQLLALKQFFMRDGATVVLLDDRTGPTHDTQLHSMVHGVIALEQHAPEYGSERRRLRVVKMRGRAYRGGYHDFRIVQGGLSLFPRVLASEQVVDFPRSVIQSGIQELDDLVGGGLDRGSSTLFMGPAGVGKSTVALAYAVAAARRGEPAALFLFDESEFLLRRRAGSLGIDLDDCLRNGTVRILETDPAEVSPGEFAHLMHEQVSEHGMRVLVIDSLNGYLNAMPGERHLVIQLHELLTSLGRRGVTTLMVVAQHGLLGAGMQAPVDASYLADALMLFRFFECQGRVRKAVSVFKNRGGAHESTIRELQFSSEGIRVGPALAEFDGVLTGAPVFRGSVEPLL